ncbi:MAG: flagellar biosynthesis anti-sigma factor FlgM [Anaerolineae bacterium]|nr:flagellar biosynthesis anti-sigma factor FlgM [Anaerolineae bacterium]MDW8099681.1 flagellar biosynthesis anti-sigma factor FlgM [Anaerolineae bacterium]
MNEMIVSDKLTSGITRAYQAQVARVDERWTPNAQPTGRLERDEIALSDEAQLLQKAKAAAMATPEMHRERVAELKRLIAEGKYEIPLDNLVIRLLGQRHDILGAE